MRRLRCCVVAGLFLAVLAGNAECQVDRNVAAGVAQLKPTITSVTHRLVGAGLPVDLTVAGRAFPANQSDTKQRLLRLRAPRWGGGEDVYYVGQPSETLGDWTSTRAEVMLPVIPFGRIFTVGLGQQNRFGDGSTFVMLSNEVQHFIPMHLLSTTPGPVPLGTTEIVVHTSGVLGARAGRVVKLGGQPVDVTRWSPDELSFKFPKPASLVIPSIREVWVESAGGLLLSTKLSVRFLGPQVQ